MQFRFKQTTSAGKYFVYFTSIEIQFIIFFFLKQKTVNEKRKRFERNIPIESR